MGGYSEKIRTDKRRLLKSILVDKGDTDWAQLTRLSGQNCCPRKKCYCVYDTVKYLEIVVPFLHTFPVSLYPLLFSSPSVQLPSGYIAGNKASIS